MAASAAAVIMGLGLSRAPAEAGSDARDIAPAPSADADLSSLPVGANDAPSTQAETGFGCTFTDRGLGDYAPWKRLSKGQLLVRPTAVSAAGKYELLLHFHGRLPVGRLIAPEGLDLVVVAVDAGVSSKDYDALFDSPDAFVKWLSEIDAAVSDSIGDGRRAQASRITLSSWSAGYRAVTDIVGFGVLAGSPGADDTPAEDLPPLGGVVLLDSLYAPFDSSGDAPALSAIEPVTAVAKQATVGGAPVFISFSEVATEGYASTEKTARGLAEELELELVGVAFGGDEQLPLRARGERGELLIEGYAGRDRAAHCAHLRLLPEVLIDKVLSRTASQQ